MLCVDLWVLLLSCSLCSFGGKRTKTVGVKKLAILDVM